MLLKLKHSWAIWNHRQIVKCCNYTRIFILFWIRIELTLFTLENSRPRWNHRLVRKSSYFIRPTQKNDFLKSMQHGNFEPTCTCQKVVPPQLLLSLQSCACWSESVLGVPRSHKCTPTTSGSVPAASGQFQHSIPATSLQLSRQVPRHLCSHQCFFQQFCSDCAGHLWGV